MTLAEEIAADLADVTGDDPVVMLIDGDATEYQVRRGAETYNIINTDGGEKMVKALAVTCAIAVPAVKDSPVTIGGERFRVDHFTPDETRTLKVLTLVDENE